MPFISKYTVPKGLTQIPYVHNFVLKIQNRCFLTLLLLLLLLLLFLCVCVKSCGWGNDITQYAAIVVDAAATA